VPYPTSNLDYGNGVGGGANPLIDAADLAADPAFTGQYRPAIVASKFGLLPSATASENVAAWGAFIDAVVTDGGEGFIPPGIYNFNASIGFTDPATTNGVHLRGIPGETRFHFTGTADCFVTQTLYPFTIEGITVYGGTRGFVDNDAGVTTSFRHVFIDCRAVLFSGAGFVSDHVEYALYDRCWAYACGDGFVATASTSAGMSNKWVQCRAQECTGIGFDIDDQIMFTLDHCEALDCNSASGMIVIRGNTFQGRIINVDTETVLGTPNTKIGISLTGTRHIVDGHYAYQLLTPLIELTAVLCEFHRPRYSACTNGIVFSVTADARNLVYDPVVVTYDAAPLTTLNRRVPQALVNDQIVSTTLNALAATGTSSTWQGANETIVCRVRTNRRLDITKLTWLPGNTSAGNYDIGIFDSAGVCLWSKGSTAFPAINVGVTETVSPTVAIGGDTTFYVALATDSATATFRGLVYTSVVEQLLSDGTNSFFRVSTFPLPTIGNTLTIGSSGSGRAPRILVRTD
jgi:hypothetical protein